MGLIKEYQRHSAKITRTRRWKALRIHALDRDEWQCVQCGTHRRLEVDHIEPVRTRPDLAWTLSNLQTLCGRCHARKTRIEIGLGRPDPAREAWKSLLRDMQRNPNKHEV
ncbi:HNH endonuclease [Rhodobacteraceae bacterium THAF1]|uniref:HNH endonuclease n=1 Tax=Palleronia sp. THAF1 TaxID=2587842 RepID=UPI000F414DA3|nr:HNH endonuclease [Palleronia sp. THAF1]QFU07291.1 HNH endonuclease [Palleronia sp. THAF1]VDC20797.1 HNH endonuclease [Rhodobacteraceae bacterium THAF1]